MFNSQHINTDPKPWYVLEADEGGQGSDGRYSEDAYIDSSMEGSHGGAVYNLAAWKPRPEFDNNPNPLLEYFRDAMASGEYNMRELAITWVALLDRGYDWGREDGIVASEAHRAHAARVLARLAALT